MRGLLLGASRILRGYLEWGQHDATMRRRLRQLLALLVRSLGGLQRLGSQVTLLLRCLHTG